MDGASPARLYATSVGALLLIGGVVGFFYSASFGAPGEVDDALGLFATNAWSNLLYAVTGAIGLLIAGYASRRYSLAAGALYLALGAWGLALGEGEAILGFLPANAADDWLRLALGALGLAAALATPAARAKPAAAT